MRLGREDDDLDAIPWINRVAEPVRGASLDEVGSHAGKTIGSPHRDRDVAYLGVQNADATAGMIIVNRDPIRLGVAPSIDGSWNSAISRDPTSVRTNSTLSTRCELPKGWPRLVHRIVRPVSATSQASDHSPSNRFDFQLAPRPPRWRQPNHHIKT